MFRPSLYWKIFGSSLALILITALVAGWTAERRIVEDIQRETESDLHKHVQFVTAILRGRLPGAYDARLQTEVRALEAQTGTRITLIRPDGVVLADSSKDPRGMDNHGTRPEVIASQSSEYGVITRRSDTLGLRMVYLAAVLRDAEARPELYVRCAMPLVRLEERLGQLRGMLLAGAGFAVLLGLLLAMVSARRLARPLRAMTDVAAAIAGGDLTQRVETSSSDEVGTLGQRFNEMAARLEQEVATIQQDRLELRAILSGMSEGVIAVDVENRAVVINAAARRMLRMEPGAQTGMPLWKTLRLPAVTDALAEAVKTGDVYATELRLARNGREDVLQLHAAPIHAEQGAARGAVLVVTDVTEREQVEAIRRDFIANASHELKTPIASIRGLVETILDDPDMSVETCRRFLQRVSRQVVRLGHLVQDMLALSRLESKDSTLTLRRTDIVAPVREMVEDARPLAVERSVELRTELPADPVTVTAEPESLRRIAGNLIDNAIKYSGRGSQVTVRLARSGSEIVLEVRDNGPGIPRDRHERIFERFYRVDEHRSRELGGTGLGLSIVKHLVQAQNGRLELESTLGEGSAFRVYFPAR